MLSGARSSPKTRKIPDLEDRIRRLEAYERWGEPTRVDIREVVGEEMWARHWNNCEAVQELMRDSQYLSLIHISEPTRPY